ncbi:uncharacterized protein MONOS_5300 [Monocercomonoides exilis]|uniref:uncharacterized protein n=1 Tax=Monocercomonoides exilis TaxID=2049356 RepID=UPI003559BD3A|nr:hypothetical protein MONOS_5300 [Monocercomonoides exilis]|eukprot:MONOS_5300.1-p1 / transcript=MONOS_5300.1 / gene=MONOS_5300 / organism=Monocercomonoides_exilis_PA203 / gene_product=unspecified product / transcript_product=unspecified product / location=Mono_scaffold00152:93082-93739(+) / protein_length=72 / sequence_SO=supercontig / SO=protein_coding / is_pseudo=false
MEMQSKKIGSLGFFSKEGKSSNHNSTNAAQRREQTSLNINHFAFVVRYFNKRHFEDIPDYIQRHTIDQKRL